MSHLFTCVRRDSCEDAADHTVSQSQMWNVHTSVHSVKLLLYFAFFLLLYTCSPGLYCINGQCFHQYILGCFKRSLHLWSNLLHVKLNHGAV